MKTRNGFVSNSSSSSFIVARLDSKTGKSLLTPVQTRLLKKNGFVMEMAYYPDQITGNPPKDSFEKKMSNWVKDIVCNQEDETSLLIKARISFMADIHYDHYSLIYDGATDALLVAQNYGKQAQMNGVDKVNFKPWREPGVEHTTGKKYIKKYEN